MAVRSKAESGVKPPRVRDDPSSSERVAANGVAAPALAAGLKDLYEIGEIPPLGHGTPRSPRERDASRSPPDLGAR
jgi:hypothetical protein